MSQHKLRLKKILIVDNRPEHTPPRRQLFERSGW